MGGVWGICFYGVVEPLFRIGNINNFMGSGKGV